MICFMQLSPTADEDMLTYLRNSTVPIVTKAQVDHKRN